MFFFFYKKFCFVQSFVENKVSLANGSFVSLRINEISVNYGVF